MTDMLITVAVYAIPAILAITLHEAAHGLAAYLCGDNTAMLMGRVTANPIRHIDPVGTLLIPGLLLLGSLVSGTTGILFGWAKPVPVNFRRLANPRTGMILVALAGPFCNLLQAFAWALFLRIVLIVPFGEAVTSLAFSFTVAGVGVNLLLLALNMIPILPLDGGRVLHGLLPWRWAVSFGRLERWGLVIVLALIVTGIVNPYLRAFLLAGRSLISLAIS